MSEEPRNRLSKRDREILSRSQELLRAAGKRPSNPADVLAVVQFSVRAEKVIDEVWLVLSSLGFGYASDLDDAEERLEDASEAMRELIERQKQQAANVRARESARASSFPEAKS